MYQAVVGPCFLRPRCCCSAVALVGQQTVPKEKSGQEQTWTDWLLTGPTRRSPIWIPQTMSSIWRAASSGAWNS